MNPYDKESINALVQFLDNQGKPNLSKNGRANLAELRRSAADPLSDTRSIWILGSLLPERDGWEFDAYRLVATLYAINAQRFTTPNGGHKLPKFSDDDKQPKYKRRSFGESVRRLRIQLGAGEDSLDKRFVALLDSDTDNLAIPLRGFIQRIASAQKDIPVDYRRLLEDLLNWNGDRQTGSLAARRQWARDYWQPVMAENDDELRITHH
jgi:CRISPR type I-E-associated protein CasB/Cse2